MIDLQSASHPRSPADSANRRWSETAMNSRRIAILALPRDHAFALRMQSRPERADPIGVQAVLGQRDLTGAIGTCRDQKNVKTGSGPAAICRLRLVSDLDQSRVIPTNLDQETAYAFEPSPELHHPRM